MPKSISIYSLQEPNTYILILADAQKYKHIVYRNQTHIFLRNFFCQIYLPRFLVDSDNNQDQPTWSLCWNVPSYAKKKKKNQCVFFFVTEINQCVAVLKNVTCEGEEIKEHFLVSSLIHNSYYQIWQMHISISKFFGSILQVRIVDIYFFRYVIGNELHIFGYM